MAGRQHQRGGMASVAAKMALMAYGMAMAVSNGWYQLSAAWLAAAKSAGVPLSKIIVMAPWRQRSWQRQPGGCSHLAAQAAISALSARHQSAVAASKLSAAKRCGESAITAASLASWLAAKCWLIESSSGGEKAMAYHQHPAGNRQRHQHGHGGSGVIVQRKRRQHQPRRWRSISWRRIGENQQWRQ